MTDRGAATDRSEFERGFVAMRALVGPPGEPLAQQLRSPTAATQRLAESLVHGERRVRATCLAAELARLALALEARRVG